MHGKESKYLKYIMWIRKLLWIGCIAAPAPKETGEIRREVFWTDRTQSFNRKLINKMRTCMDKHEPVD